MDSPLRRWVLALVLLLVPGGLWAGSSETLNTMPVQDSSFLSTMRTHLRQETPALLARYSSGTPWVRAGGTHATAGTCTSAAFSLEAFTSSGNHITADGAGGTVAINYGATNIGANCSNPGSDVCWVVGSSAGQDFGSSNTRTVVTLPTLAGSAFARVGSSNLFVDCTSATEPTLPADSVWLMKVTMTNGAITQVDALHNPHPLPQGAVVTGLVNAADYGLSASATNNAVALTRALAALPATGGTILVQHGTYLFTTGIDLVDKRNITLACVSTAVRYANTQACTFQYSAASGALLTFNGAVGITLRGLNLSSTHATYADNLVVIAQGTGIQDSSNILIEDCAFIGNTSGSMTATALLKLGDEMYGLTVQRTVFANAAIGIQGSTTSVINANSIWITHNLFLPTFTVAHIQAGGSQWNINENIFEPRTGVIGSSIGVTAIGVNQLQLMGNLFVDANSASTIWFQATAGIIRGLHVAGNTFIDVHASSTCLSLGAAVGVTIVGNYFNCGVNVVAGSATDMTMTGNFHGGGTTAVSGYPSGQSLINDNASFQIGAAGGAQAVPLLGVRNASSGNALEWGLFNPAGYGNVLGHTTGTGHGFVCLSCEQGTNVNTYKTRGKVGRYIENDLAGRMVFGAAVDSNTDNQTGTPHMRLDAYGDVEFGGTAGSTVSLGSCGTTPAIVGNNTVGRVTTGTTMGTTCAVVFGGAGFANTPICLVQPTATSDTVSVQSITTAGFTIVKTGGGNLSDSTVHAYFCAGRF